MKTELQQKLLDKYPEFFQKELKIYIGEDTLVNEVGKLMSQQQMVLPIQFGVSCGDGWYMLLDVLMAEIRNHISNENRNRANEFRYKWMWKLQRYFRIRFTKKIFEKIADWIYKHAPKGPRPSISLEITQIKEKFGGLCFYYVGGDNEIRGMVRLAESMSYKICESCGTTHNVGRTKGWFYTVCKPCYDKNSRANKLVWEQLSD